jgi:hypothetical protein
VPDAVLTDAAKEIIGISIVGPICILLICLLAWREKVSAQTIKFWQDKYETSQEARLKEVREFATTGEEMRDTQRALVVAVNANIEALKERPRR